MNPEIPVEYEKGYTKFLNCKIDLRNRVFIPRTETGFWVKKAIKAIKAIKELSSLREGLKVLDIFAGSGCIGISILKNVENSFVDFVDIDKKAIEQIKINLKLNLPRTELVLVRGKISPKRYKIYQSNLFEKLKGKYNYIFANPPYAAKEKLKEVQPSVLRYEPRRAILGGKKGLLYIRKFLKEAKKFMKPDGTIYFEFDPEQKNEISNILRKENYKNSKFFKDQFKKYRFVKVQI